VGKGKMTGGLWPEKGLSYQTAEGIRPPVRQKSREKTRDPKKSEEVRAVGKEATANLAKKSQITISMAKSQEEAGGSQENDKRDGRGEVKIFRGSFVSRKGH